MSFSDQTILSTWQKGEIIINYDSSKWRKDQCGAWITYSQYGNRDSDFGWEIDHINPNGGDNPSNLRPLHWINNLEKSDGKLTCPIVANGKSNIRRH